MTANETSDRSGLALAGAFPAAGEPDWLRLVETVLKGADFEKRLVTRTADGIALWPLYQRAEPASAAFRADAARPWRVACPIDHPEPATANGQALEDLAGGADELVLRIGSGLRGHGLAIASRADLERALSGVKLEMIRLRLEAGAGARPTAAMLAALVRSRGHAAGEVDIAFGMDPIGTLAATGTLDADWAQTARRLSEAVAALAGDGLRGPFVCADGRPYHDAGATEAQELAAVLATGAAYLRVLGKSAMPLPAASGAIAFTLAADADQIVVIAKLRAMRRLWARVEEACGLAPRPIRLDAETSWRMMSRRDPWVNILRTTLAAFSAAVGGADSISVLPYTAALGLPDAFARRIARNTGLVLQEESSLWRVADPAAGAGVVERLTAELAGAAWTRFQQIEREGGIMASLTSGALQGRIAESRARLIRDVATRRVALTGTSEFANLREAPVGVLDPRSAAAPPLVDDAAMTFAELLADPPRSGAGRTGPHAAAAVTSTPLAAFRLSAPFEALRDRADRHEAANGRRWQVFIAALGPVSEHAQRATWTTNLLSAGGIEAIVPAEGITQSLDAGRQFAESGCKVACLCGTDEAYGELGEAAASSLKAAGAPRVLLAGRPGKAEAALRAAGVDGFLYAGIDVVETLGNLQDELAAGP